MPFTDFSDPGFKAFPRRFGAYTLLRPLSRGGMGEVFLARTGALIGAERLCVLKTVRGDLANDDDYVRRFVDEARVAVTLTHSGVCHVFDAGRVGTRLYLAMEHIAGLTLRELTDVLTQKHRELTGAYVLHIVIELLEALDYAHNHRHPETGQRMSVVHRDVSPQNVMASFEGDVKLIDFGLSKSGSADQTSDDMVMGKLFYMSPEQARGDAVDGRTDQFSAAVVAYELFTGHRFYGERDRNDVTSVVGVGGFVPDLLDRVPTEVRRVLLRALSADADARYATCGEMAAELRMILSRSHPMMSRSMLKSFLASAVAEEQDAYRAQIRELPAAAVAPGKEAEHTQSFMLAPKTATAGHTERLVRTPNDTDETAHVSTGNPKRSTPWLALVGGAAAVAIATLLVARVAALPDTRAALASSQAPSAVAPVHASPGGAAPSVAAAMPVAPSAPVVPEQSVPGAPSVPGGASPSVPGGPSVTGVAAPSVPVADPSPPVAPSVVASSAPEVAVADEPAPRPMRSRPTTSRVRSSASRAKPVPAASPVAPRKLPGTLASKRDIVSQCDVCKGIKNQIREGKDVAEEVLDSCIRRCRAGQGQP